MKFSMKTLADAMAAPPRKRVSALDAIAYVVKLRIAGQADLARLVAGRVWNANEVPPNPTWPFVIISDVKATGGGVRISVEAWGRWTPESETMALAIRRALPTAFFLLKTEYRRPNGGPGAAAVVSMSFSKEADDAP